MRRRAALPPQPASGHSELAKRILRAPGAGVWVRWDPHRAVRGGQGGRMRAPGMCQRVGSYPQRRTHGPRVFTALVHLPPPPTPEFAATPLSSSSERAKIAWQELAPGSSTGGGGRGNLQLPEIRQKMHSLCAPPPRSPWRGEAQGYRGRLAALRGARCPAPGATGRAFGGMEAELT